MIHFYKWGYSSVVEHSTADREVTGSNPVAPFIFFLHNFFQFFSNKKASNSRSLIHSLKLKCRLPKSKIEKVYLVSHAFSKVLGLSCFSPTPFG